MIANYHTHTYRCGHACGEEEAYVQEALKRGLKQLGFSDHAPYFFPGDYYSNFRMRPEELPGYVATIAGLRKMYGDRMAIHIGLETEYYPAYFPQLLPFLQENGIEYLLLGQHCLRDEISGDYSGIPTHREEDLKAYCYTTMEAMQTGLFTYFAHPDMCRFVGDDTVYTRYIRELCREAKSCAVPLEYNLLGVEDVRFYPTRRFWEIVAEEGCPVVLGCDAHRPEALSVTEPEEKALAVLQELGLTPLETVPLRPLG